MIGLPLEFSVSVNEKKHSLGIVQRRKTEFKKFLSNSEIEGLIHKISKINIIYSYDISIIPGGYLPPLHFG